MDDVDGAGVGERSIKDEGTPVTASEVNTPIAEEVAATVVGCSNIAEVITAVDVGFTNPLDKASATELELVPATTEVVA